MTTDNNLEMVCTCRLEGIQSVEQARLGAFKALGLTKMQDLLPTIIMSLAFDFGADAEVYADQWFGVNLSTPLIAKGGLWIECDDPADGLLALWAKLGIDFPGRVYGLPRTPAADSACEAAKALSDQALAGLADLRAGEQEHRKVHGDEYKHDCAECGERLNRYCDAHIALEDAWGVRRAMDATVRRAFGD